MEHFVQIAQRVVEETSNILNFPLSLTDDQGYIIGCTDTKRVGSLHLPTKDVLNKGEFICFHRDDVLDLENVYPGVAIPLTFDHQSVLVLGIVGEPCDVLPFAKLVKRHVEMLWHETYRLEIRQLEAKTVEAFFQYLLLNVKPDKERINTYCQLLKVNPLKNRHCVLVDFGVDLFGFDQTHFSQQSFKSFSMDRRQAELLSCFCTAFQTTSEDAASFLNAGQMVMLKSAENVKDPSTIMADFDKRAKTLLKMLSERGVDDAFVVAGDIQDTMYRINESFQSAKLLLESKARYTSSRRVLSYFHWDTLLSLLPQQIDPFLKGKLLKRLQPLVNQDDFFVLAESFIGYCQHNMNISQAARALFVHRNTLIYRLNKIEKITGLQINAFEHCTILYLVLKNIIDLNEKSKMQ